MLVDEIPNPPQPQKYAIYGVICHILFYPVAIVVFFVEARYGILTNLIWHQDPGFESLILLVLATTILPVIGSYNMKKALNIAKKNNSKVGFYKLLFIISVFHIVIIISLIFWWINVHSYYDGMSDLDPCDNPENENC